MSKTAIIALGGNALSQKKQAGTIAEQFNNTRHSFEQIMEFLRRDYNICLTHGNGPQVGDELLRMDLTRETVPPLPLGVCVAGTQGTMGYMIQQTFQNALRAENIDKEVVTLVTQVIINPEDPSLKNPSKFVGKRYSEEEATALSKELGWDIKEQEPGDKEYALFLQIDGVHENQFTYDLSFLDLEAVKSDDKRIDSIIYQ